MFFKTLLLKHGFPDSRSTRDLSFERMQHAVWVRSSLKSGFYKFYTLVNIMRDHVPRSLSPTLRKSPKQTSSSNPGKWSLCDIGTNGLDVEEGLLEMRLGGVWLPTDLNIVDFCRKVHHLQLGEHFPLAPAHSKRHIPEGPTRSQLFHRLSEGT